MKKISLKKQLEDLIQVSLEHINKNQKKEMWQNKVFLMEIIYKFSSILDFMTIFEIAVSKDDNLQNDEHYAQSIQYHIFYRLITDLIIILYKRFEMYKNILKEIKRRNLGFDLKIESFKNEVNKFKYVRLLIDFFRNLNFHIEVTWTKELKNIFLGMSEVNKDMQESVLSFMDLEKNTIEFSKENLINRYKRNSINNSKNITSELIIYDSKDKKMGLLIGNLIINIKFELFIQWLLSILFKLINNSILINFINFFNNLVYEMDK